MVKSGDQQFEEMVREYCLRKGELDRAELIADVYEFECMLRDRYGLNMDLMTCCIAELDKRDVI